MMIIDAPGTVFETVASDIVGTLPKTKDNNEYILTILFKFSIAAPLPNTLATTIADVYIPQLYPCNEIYLGNAIVSDNNGKKNYWN